MQQMLTSLSKSLTDNKDSIMKKTGVNEAKITGWANTLIDVGMRKRGTAQWDGIWGPATQKALRAAEELAGTLRRGKFEQIETGKRGANIPKIVDGPTYKQTDAKTLQTNAVNNIKALTYLSRALGVTLPGMRMRARDYILDHVKKTLVEAEIGEDFGEAGTVPVTAANIVSLVAFFDFLEGNRFDVQMGSAKTAAEQPDFVKLAHEIRDSLIIRMAQRVPGPPARGKAVGELEGEAARKKDLEARKNKQYGTPGAQARMRKGIGQEAAMAGRPPARPVTGPGGGKKKEEGKPKQEAAIPAGAMTVAKFNNALYWFHQRSQGKWNTIGRSVQEEGFATQKGEKTVDWKLKYTKDEWQKARYYYGYMEKLNRAWQRIKTGIMKKEENAGKKENMVVLTRDDLTRGRERGGERRGPRGPGGRAPATQEAVNTAFQNPPLGDGRQLYVPDLYYWFERSKMLDTYEKLNSAVSPTVLQVTRFESQPWDVEANRLISDRRLTKGEKAQKFRDFCGLLSSALTKIKSDWDMLVQPYARYRMRGMNIPAMIDKQSRIFNRWSDALGKQQRMAHNAYLDAGGGGRAARSEAVRRERPSRRPKRKTTRRPRPGYDRPTGGEWGTAASRRV
jgi:hypothetical protein